MMRGMARIWIVATVSLTLAATAEACQRFRTYDFGSPGAYSNKKINAYWYFIGRVVSVEPHLIGGFSTKVRFEILKDYRPQSSATVVTAYLKPNRCVGLPELGAVGKFAIDEQDDTRVLAHTSSLLYPKDP